MLSGFNTEGCLRVRVVRWSLGGGGAHTSVTSCTLEVEYEGDRHEEVTIAFEEGTFALASLQGWEDALNAVLSKQR